MRITINTDIAKEYGMAGAVVWAAFEKLLDEKKWTQIRVAQLVSMTDKLFSETPFKVAIRKMESNGLIDRLSEAACDGAQYRFGINSTPYYRKRLSQIEQHQSPSSSSPVHQDISSGI